MAHHFPSAGTTLSSSLEESAEPVLHPVVHCNW